MKKIISIIVLLVFIVGCSADVTNNPTTPQEDIKSKTLLKQSELENINHEKVYPSVLKFLEDKQKEKGQSLVLNSQNRKAKKIDITKISGIVVPSLDDIRKLSLGNAKYYSEQNQLLTESFELRYSSWCIPYPSPSKPWFEYLGSEQRAFYNQQPISMYFMYVESDHFLGHNFLDYVYNTGYNIHSIEASSWYEQVYEPLWEVVGYHYCINFNPYVQFEALSYAYDYD
jgi:uncharacterized protein YxeA